MQIIWLGHAAFKIIDKEVTVAIDPYDSVGLRMPKFTAQILVCTSKKPDHYNTEAIKGEPFLIDGPGEFEIKDVFIYGVDCPSLDKDPKNKITLFTVEMEGIKVGHLGDIQIDNLSEAQMEILNGVDILLVPVGGQGMVDAPKAVKLVQQIEPRIIIPYSYSVPGLSLKLDKIDVFLKEMGAAKAETLPKLLIKEKDLPQEESKVILLAKE